MRSDMVAGLLALALLGCTPGRLIPQPDTASDEGILMLDGQVLLPRAPAPTPTPTGPAGIPAGEPVAEAYTPFAVHVSVSCDHLDLNVAPQAGRPETYRSTARASALVTLSNGLKTSDVTWESSDPTMATVDAQGHIRGVGSQSGQVDVTAYSRDRRASGAVRIMVTNLGDAEVIVE